MLKKNLLSSNIQNRYLQLIRVCLAMGKRTVQRSWFCLSVWGWRGVEGGCFVKSNMTAKMYYTVNQYACHVVLLVFRVSEGQGSPLKSLWCHSLGFKCRYVCILYYSHILGNAVYTLQIPFFFSPFTVSTSY